jgi:hypothetical protein
VGSSGVRGDFGRLEALGRNLARFSKADYQKELLADLGAEAVVQIEQGINGQRDPYGKPWPRKKGTGGPVLKGLLGTFSARVKGRRRVIVASSDPAAVFHQNGTTKIPRRLLLPLRTRGLPPRWAKAFRAIAWRRLRAAIKGE